MTHFTQKRHPDAASGGGHRDDSPTAWVEQMAPELRAGPTQLEPFEQLEVEQGNFQAEPELGAGDRNLLFNS